MKLYAKCANIRMPFDRITVAFKHREKHSDAICSFPAANQLERQGGSDRGDNTVKHQSISGGIGTLL
jgi:hypothetical protein